MRIDRDLSLVSPFPPNTGLADPEHLLSCAESGVQEPLSDSLGNTGGWITGFRRVAESPGALPRRSRDTRGEALPVAILFVGVLLTVLIGIHVVVVALARTAVQSAADSAVSAAQAAAAGEREAEGVLAARLALAGARASVRETRLPVVTVESERGSVAALVFGGVNTPVLGTLHLTARACAPLDDVPAAQLTAADAWEC